MRNQSWLNLRKDANYLITGASSGIGLATTKALLDFGCSVTGCVRDTKSIIELCEKYPNFSYIEYNAKEEINLLKEKIKDLPTFQGLIFSHGVTWQMPAQLVDESALNSHILVNFTSIPIFIGELLRKRKILKDSSIVMISSISSFAGTRGMSFYSGAKAGLDGYMRSLAVELAPKNIRVNSIAPYVVRSPIHKDSNGKLDWLEERYQHMPLGIGEPEDVAGMILFLLSNDAGYITGQSIRMSGLETWVR